MAESEIKPPKLSSSGSSSGGGWVSEHKGLVAGGVIGLALLAYLFARSRSKKSGTTAGGNVATPQIVYPSSGTSGGYGGGGGTGYGMYQALATNLAQGNQNLAAQLSALNATQHAILDAITAASNPASTTTNTKPTQPTPTATYEGLANWTAAKAANATGISIYDKVAPGVFGKITPKNFHPTGGAKGGGGITTLAPGTGLYVLK